MNVIGFNESNSEKSFLFYVNDTNELRSYYRISIDEMRELLKIEEMSAKEIESTTEFKELDKETLIRNSKLYVRRIN